MTPDTLPLRDIHLPPEPGWWPPAPGWWLIAAVLLGAGVAAYAWRRRRRAYAAHRDVLARLAALERARPAAPEDVLAELSVLLRRLALTLYPRQRVAGLTGRAWLNFLGETGGGGAFAADAGHWLLDGPYRRDARPARAELEALFDAARGWVRAQPPLSTRSAPC